MFLLVVIHARIQRGDRGPDPSSHFLTVPLEMVASTTFQIYVSDILNSYKVGKIY